jgi:hypothetical protein
MTALKIMLKQKIRPLCLFIILILISHLLLPRLDKSNLGPFSNWMLFANSENGPYYDILIDIKLEKIFLTDISSRQINTDDSYDLWSLSQELGHSVQYKNTSQTKVRKSIRAKFDRYGMQYHSLCKIQIKLADYIVLTSEKKRDHCEIVSEKI